MSSWTDQFVGDRMAVDREFSERVAASEFSSQEWGTIMTAVELDVENPESPADARLVADTSQVDQVLPALEEMRQAMPGAAGGAAGSGSSSSRSGRSDSGGFLQSIKRSLGLGSGADDQRAESAAALADEYARQFQEHLEERGKWERACAVAASTDGERGVADVAGSASAAQSEASEAEAVGGDYDGTESEDVADSEEFAGSGELAGSEDLSGSEELSGSEAVEGSDEMAGADDVAGSDELTESEEIPGADELDGSDDVTRTDEQE